MPQMTPGCGTKRSSVVRGCVLTVPPICLFALRLASVADNHTDFALRLLFLMLSHNERNVGGVHRVAKWPYNLLCARTDVSATYISVFVQNCAESYSFLK